MAIDPKLLEILACPKCKGSLEYREAEASLICHDCRLRYRIEGTRVTEVDPPDR